MQTHEITKDSLPLDRLEKGQGHKFSHGSVLVVCGGAGRTGAARLAARSALRIGAGLVTLAVPPEALGEVASQITALMVREVKDAKDLEDLLSDDRINALCIGPGLGLTADAAALVEAALESGRGIVLDADALSLMAKDDALFAKLHENCVVTPHAGEFARLFPQISEKLGDDQGAEKVKATAEAAAQAGCVVVLKGALSVIASPGGRVGLHQSQGARAAPWLATAGAGDVLAGVISGLLARGIPPPVAAELAAFLHVEAALSFGPGLIAEDLPEELPKVLRALRR